MPKQSLVIKDFSGLNTSKSASSIEDSECRLMRGWCVNENGGLRQSGKIRYWPPSGSWSLAAPAPIEQDITPGYGLFLVESDYNNIVGGIDPQENTAGEAKPTAYIFVLGNDGNLYFAENGVDQQLDSKGMAYCIDDTFTNWDNTNTIRPSFYYIDSGVRICDGNFDNLNNDSIWVGYIKRTDLEELVVLPGNADAGFTIDQWYMSRAKVRSYLNEVGADVSQTTTDGDNTDAFIHRHHGTQGTWATPQSYLNHGNAANMTNFRHPILSMTHKDDPDGEGSWVGGEYYSFSYIYDNGQETTPSLLYKTTGIISGSTSTARRGSKRFKLWMNKRNVTETHNKRIIGYNIYYSEYTTDDSYGFGFIKGSEDYLILEARFNKGVRSAYEDGWQPWIDDSIFNNQTQGFLTHSHAIQYEHVPTAKTFKDINGYDGNTKTTEARYKTAVTLNRRTYIGNIYQDGVANGDAMIKSPVNQFDTFPPENQIEVTVGDGDSIVALHAYADRILQFKSSKVHVINASQQIEYLEDTFYYNGVNHPASVTTTELGIVWANSQGCYLYNGSNLINLLEKRGEPIISQAEWSNFISTPVVGYDAKNKIIIIAGNVVTNVGKGSSKIEGYSESGDGQSFYGDLNGGDIRTDGMLYFYDLKSKSWNNSWHGEVGYYSGDTIDTGDAEDNLGYGLAIESIDPNHQYVSNFITNFDGSMLFMNHRGIIDEYPSGGEFNVASMMVYKHAKDILNPREYLDGSRSSWVSKSFDFGAPGQLKKIYGVIVDCTTGNQDDHPMKQVVEDATADIGLGLDGNYYNSAVQVTYALDGENWRTSYNEYTGTNFLYTLKADGEKRAMYSELVNDGINKLHILRPYQIHEGVEYDAYKPLLCYSFKLRIEAPGAVGTTIVTADGSQVTHTTYPMPEFTINSITIVYRVLPITGLQQKKGGTEGSTS